MMIGNVGCIGGHIVEAALSTTDLVTNHCIRKGDATTSGERSTDGDQLSNNGTIQHSAWQDLYSNYAHYTV